MNIDMFIECKDALKLQECYVDTIFLYENSLFDYRYERALAMIVEGIYLICAIVCI